ncbi:MAG: NUDIX hydrolase [Hyphomicrobiaceae bacterium]
MAVPKTPLLAVDCVVRDAHGRILLITRAKPPYRGQFALPGGFVNREESVEDACRREVLEETGLQLKRIRLVGVYSQPGRDPRGPTCSVAYFASVRSGRVKGGDDAREAAWVANWREVDLAFDHHKIITDALRLARNG